MTEHIRIAVIGTSWWTDLMHLPTLKSHPQAQVVALCGRNQRKAESMARKHAIPKVFTDYEQMIKTGGLDAVVIATPDDQHYAMTMAALEAKLHVLCEKPLAQNSYQAEEMLAKAEAAGVKHMVFFTYRWAPQSRYLNQLLDEGYLGTCYHCHFRRSDGFGRSPHYNWIFDPERANGVLGYYGADMIDFARWFVGDIVRVSASLGNHVQRFDATGQAFASANDVALLTVEFENGAQGIIRVSGVDYLADRGQEQRITLYGKRGSLQAELKFGGADASAVVYGTQAGEAHFEALPIPESLIGPTSVNPLDIFQKQSVGGRLFIEAILNDSVIHPNFYDGLQVQRVIDAALAAHEKGGWIDVKTS